ncbi:aldo-keto reductase [Cryptococcus gattii Ru294]|uniref:Aldo-keto reductase n=1 Tax=Cryptococcus gattii EJB2 TaxID=1296103 RepID=A0ABR5BZP7_9TREE|nr:aldo-keto reductase [Cryptococcus gattii Ru294]KIR81106.1 aldo-keto reductase [Cryptococcus gattii EJB2]
MSRAISIRLSNSPKNILSKMPRPAPVKSLDARLKMHDGNAIPQFGLGVYEMNDKETYDCVKWALEAGYRHVDTAEWYENEAPCGKAITDFLKATGTPREEIFLTSKLKNNAGYEEALTDLKNSLKRSGVEYFDLYLMHSAIGGPIVRKNVWKALCDAQSQGLVKSIGVSNFGKKHIQEFIDQKVPLPTVNQVDLHPFMRHPEIVEICEQNEILLEAWGPLARAMRFDHPVLVKIAKEKGKDAAQIMLRWGIQHGFVIIPKSVSQKRIVSNSKIFDFELSIDEMKELDGLDEYLVTDWDVVDCE